MAHATFADRIQKSYKKNAKKLKKSHFSPLLAGLAGAFLAIPLMLAIVVPIMHHEFAAQAASLDNQLVAMAPTSSITASQPSRTSNLVCTEPNRSSESAPTMTSRPRSLPTVQAASATMPSQSSSSSSTPSNNVIIRMIGDYHTENNAKIEETGADSTNQVAQTTDNSTTITNRDELSVVNNNPQTASSGNVSSSSNTKTADAVSGTASNSADVSFIFKVNN